MMFAGELCATSGGVRVAGEFGPAATMRCSRRLTEAMRASRSREDMFSARVAEICGAGKKAGTATKSACRTAATAKTVTTANAYPAAADTDASKTGTPYANTPDARNAGTDRDTAGAADAETDAADADTSRKNGSGNRQAG
jgi:hypothetical protein